MRDPGLRSEHRAELQVGLLVLAGFAALVAGVLWVTGGDVTTERYRLYAVAEQANQVSEGSRVYVRGVDVGSVRGVRLQRDRVVLSLSLGSEVRLPRDSRAVIEPAGFLGTQMVRLLPGAAAATAGPGDTLSVTAGPDLQSLATTLGEEARTVLGRAARLLDDTTVTSVRSGARDLSSTLRDLRALVESERETLSRLVANLERTSEGLSRATSGPRLERTVARIDSLTVALDSTGRELTASSRSLSSILAKVDSGEGSLGLLVNDERLYERVTAAAENLRTASEEIALLSRDVRERPRRYLEGLDFSVF